VLEIEPYAPGSNATPHGATVFKLSSNETPLGPSPDAVSAYHETAEHLAVYPDGSGAALRAAIGRNYELNLERIVCGAGSDELPRPLAHAFLGPGDEASLLHSMTKWCGISREAIQMPAKVARALQSMRPYRELAPQQSL
jgi:histidinol-phosphate/aromatic aminotransferase/cobyric acid decarboxylase-like protein